MRAEISDKIVDIIDSILTVIFWLPAKTIGYKKCSKCTIRVRWYQFLILSTWFIKVIPAIRSRRIDWKLRTDISSPTKDLSLIFTEDR